MPDAGQESKISRGWGESRQPRLRSAKAEKVSAGAVLPGEAPQLPEVPGLLVHLAVEREGKLGWPSTLISHFCSVSLVLLPAKLSCSAQCGQMLKLAFL